MAIARNEYFSFLFSAITKFRSVHFVIEWRWLSSFPATLVPARALKPCPGRRLCLRMWKVSINELILLTTHPASFIASVTFPIASSIMSTMPAWVRLALLLIPRYFCSYFRSTLNGPCTLWNGRYKNKGLDALCDRITLLACCSIEKETQVINWFGNVLLTWFSLIFWSWQDGFVKTPKGFVGKQITEQFLCEILLQSRFIAKHFLITKTGAKRTDEFVKVFV